MISYDEALAAVLAASAPLGAEHLPLADLPGRVLADPVYSQIDLPPFDNSAMDGYAVHAPVEGPLEVIGEIAAGDDPGRVRVRPSTAVRIFTGSAVPEGANAIVMQENTTRSGNSLLIGGDVEPALYIRRKGEELARGDELVASGTFVNPAVLGLLAAAGVSSANVYLRPRVSVVETGAELIDPGTDLRPGSVFAANGLALGSAATSLGAIVKSFRCGDDASELESTLTRAAEGADLLITSGGVSVGDHDLVRPALARIGVREKFWRAAIRPGRPVFLGIREPKLVVLGLPGNPASSMVTFFLFARAALLAMQGLEGPSPESVKLGQAVEPSENAEIFLRVRLSNGVAYPVVQQGSNMASSVALADALVRIPRGDRVIPAGSALSTLRLLWSLG